MKKSSQWLTLCQEGGAKLIDKPQLLPSERFVCDWEGRQHTAYSPSFMSLWDIDCSHLCGQVHQRTRDLFWKARCVRKNFSSTWSSHKWTIKTLALFVWWYPEEGERVQWRTREKRLTKQRMGNKGKRKENVITNELWEEGNPTADSVQFKVRNNRIRMSNCWVLKTWP